MLPVSYPAARAVSCGVNARRRAPWSPRALFAAGEQGWWFDNNDLSTMLQDNAGTIPVTGPGQPVGLHLDKSRGLVVSAVNSASATSVNGVPIGGPTLTQYTIATGLVVGRWYRVRATVTNYSGTSTVGFTSGPNAFGAGSNGVIAGLMRSSNGVIEFVGLAATTTQTVFTRDANTANFSDISIRELPGNHRYQTTAASRPILRDAPRRIDYDQVDDSLTGTFPSSLGSNCTVARSIPGVGAQILTAQTIGTSFTDNVDNCGLIIVNRALTAAETANLTRYLNQRAGV